MAVTKDVQVQRPPVTEEEAADLRARVEILESENAELRAAVETLRAAGPGGAKTFGDRKPRRPSFGLSAGEASDLSLHGVTSSPFTGETLTASGEGIKPGNDEARAADRRAAARTGE